MLHLNKSSLLDAENLPRQHRATVGLHDFIDETLNGFFAIAAFGCVGNEVCLNENLVLHAVNLSQGVMMTDKVCHAVYLL